MKKILALMALSLMMISATAMDYEKPTPFVDVGICYVQPQASEPATAQVVEYAFAPVDYALVETLPVFLETMSFEQDATEYAEYSTPLPKVELYASSEPPAAFYGMTMQASPLQSKHRNIAHKRRC